MVVMTYCARRTRFAACETLHVPCARRLEMHNLSAKLHIGKTVASVIRRRKSRLSLLRLATAAGCPSAR